MNNYFLSPKNSRQIISNLSLILLILISSATFAAPPTTINYQGYLTNEQGMPIDAVTNTTFRLYPAVDALSELWSETLAVNVEKGLFSVELNVSSIAPLEFENVLFLGIQIEGETEMLPRNPVTLTAYSIKAEDANSVAGVSGGFISDHLNNVIDNPHNVTSAQTGADVALATHANNSAAHHSRYSDSEAVNAMGAKTNENPLNHDRRTGGQVFNAVIERDGAGSGLDTDFLDGLDSSAFAPSGHNHDDLYYQKPEVDLAVDDLSNSIRLHTHTGLRYAKVAIVAISGSEYTSPIDAMNDSDYWCGQASAINPCLLKLMPGRYDLGPNALVMKPFIDIQGSGRKNTTIISDNSNATVGVDSAALVAADNTEVSFITINNQGGGANAIGIYNNYSGFKLSEVASFASGATHRNIGFFNEGANSTLVRSRVEGIGGLEAYGFYNIDARPSLTEINASANSASTDNFGVFNVLDQFPQMRDVNIKGVLATGKTLYVRATDTPTENGQTLLKISSIIDGLTNRNGATSERRIFAALDAGIFDIGSQGLLVPPFVTLSGSGETTTTILAKRSVMSVSQYDENSAAIILTSNSTISDVLIENQGISASYSTIGIFINGPAFRIKNTSVKVTEYGNRLIGIYNSSGSDIEIVNSTVVTSGLPGIDWGVWVYSGSATIASSKIVSEVNSLMGLNYRVANTQLRGTVAVATLISCIGAYDENFVALDVNCR